MYLYAIKDLNTNKIIKDTISFSEDGAWNKYLGFSETDDMWGWRKQWCQEGNLYCIEVDVVQKENIEIDQYIKNYQELVIKMKKD